MRDPCVDGMLISLTNQCQHPDCGIMPYFYHGETRQGVHMDFCIIFYNYM